MKGQPERDCHKRKDTQQRTDRTRQPERNSQQSKTSLLGKDCQDRTSRTRLSGKDSQKRTARKRQPAQDRQEWTGPSGHHRVKLLKNTGNQSTVRNYACMYTSTYTTTPVCKIFSINLSPLDFSRQSLHYLKKISCITCADIFKIF